MWPRIQWLGTPALFLCILELRAVVAVDVDFDGLISRLALENSSIPVYIPKVVHFVYVTLESVGWAEYAAVRSAVVNLHADTINIWVPIEGDFPDEMWPHILQIPGVVVRRVEMPDTVYGHKVEQQAHVSDLVRLQVMYSEGGE